MEVKAEITVNELEELVRGYVKSLMLYNYELNFNEKIHVPKYVGYDFPFNGNNFAEKINLYNNTIQETICIHNFNNINDLVINNLENVDLKIISDSDYFTIRYILLIRERLKLRLFELELKIIDEKKDIVEIELSMINNNLDLNKQLADNIIQIHKNKKIDKEILITSIQKINIKNFLRHTEFLNKYNDDISRKLMYNKYKYIKSKNNAETYLKKNDEPNITDIDIQNMAKKYIDNFLNINWIIEDIFDINYFDEIFRFCFTSSHHITDGYLILSKKINDINLSKDCDFFIIKFILHVRNILKENLNISHTIDSIKKFNKIIMNNMKFDIDECDSDYQLEVKIRIKRILDNINLRLKNDIENLIIEHNNIKNVNIYVFLNLTQYIENKFPDLENKSIYLPETEIMYA